MIFHENRLQMILMKYHILFFPKIRKDVTKFAAVVIDALRVKIQVLFMALQLYNTFKGRFEFSFSTTFQERSPFSGSFQACESHVTVQSGLAMT